MKEDKLHSNNLEERLRREAENFEMQPSDAVWEHIRGSLPSGGKRLYLLRWAAVAAVLLVLAGLGWYFLQMPVAQKDSSTSGALVLTDSVQSVQKAPGNADQGVAGLKNAEVAGAGQEGKAPAVSKDKSLEADHYASGQQRGPAYSTWSPKEAAAGRSAAGKTRKSQAKADHPLPLLTRLDWLSGGAGVNPEDAVTSLHYSDRIVQLMLTEAHTTGGLLAQNSAAAAEKSKITFGIYFTPGMSYRTLKTGGRPSSGGRMMASPNSPNIDGIRPGNAQEFASSMRINTTDKPLQQKQGWGWGSGIRVALHLPDNWLLQSGLSLRQTNYDITAYRQDPAYVYNNGAAYTMAAAPMANSNYAQYASRNIANDQVTTLENSYLSTELPLLIGRRFGSPDAFSVTVLAGAGLTYLLHANSVMYAPNSQRYFTDEDYLSPFNGSLILEANMNVPLGKNLGFSIGPAFQYQMFSSYKGYDPVSEFPYLIGLKTAFHLK